METRCHIVPLMNGMPNSKIELSLCLVQQPVVLKKQGNTEILDTALSIGMALTAHGSTVHNP